jgi:CheY-like chemotaxis protein
MCHEQPFPSSTNALATSREERAQPVTNTKLIVNLTRGECLRVGVLADRPPPLEQGGELARLKPMRVLVISPDRRFRGVTSMLLGHRGCSVTTTAKTSRVAALIAHEHSDVVVLDASQSLAVVAQTLTVISALAQPIGVVVVDEAPPGPHRRSALAKWGPFEVLFAAIERADRRPGTWGAAGRPQATS